MSEIAKLTENLEQAKKRVTLPFEHDVEIEKLTAELAELDKKLSGVTEQQDVIIDDEDDVMVETAVEKAEREAMYSVDDDDYQPVHEYKEYATARAR